MEIRPRRATEIVDASFQLTRRFFPQLVTVSALAMAPSVIYRIIERDAMSNPQLVTTHPGAFIGVGLVALLCFVVCEAVLTAAISTGYLEGAIDLGLAFNTGVRKLPWVVVGALFRYLLLVLVVMVVAVFVAAIGMLKTPVLFVLLVPFALWVLAYLLLRTFAVTQVIVLEDTGPVVGISRALSLSKDCTAHIFFSLGLAFLLYFIISGIVSVLGLTLLTPTTAGIVGALVIIPIYPLIPVVSTLLYYDLRIRKEGFDLEIMSRELGGTTAPLPAA
jgi:hypothetical protein